MNNWSTQVQSEVGTNTFARYQYRVATNGRAIEIRFNENDDQIWQIPLDEGHVALIKFVVYHWYQDSEHTASVPADCLNSPAFQGIPLITDSGDSGSEQ